MECGICFETRIAAYMPCAHSVCAACLMRMTACPFCRTAMPPAPPPEEEPDCGDMHDRVSLNGTVYDALSESEDE